MKITKKQLKRIIKEEKRKLLEADPYGDPPRPGEQGSADGDPYSQTADSVPGSAEVPPEFTSMCMENIDLLIGEANMMGMSFPDIIGEIQKCLDQLASEGW